MLKPRTRWKVQQQEDEKVQAFVEHLQIQPLIAKLLLNRGIETIEEAKRFLHKEKLDYYDPFLLDGMEKAVKRIQEAITNGERLLVFGDYDADGVSSTSVMVYTLRELGAIFDYYIPNRFTEGYGPNESALRWAKTEGYSLVVTVDTGIAAVHEAEVAKEIGLDFIVTDHHEAPPVLPDAYSIINPKKPGCTYPFKGLAGVGVAFKVAHALLGRVPHELLDLVVIGTIADLVPLVDENRLLAKQGLAALQASSKPGIRALKKVCGFRENEPLQAEHVGFGIGPRINAAGRLDSARPAVELLITADEEEARQLADEIDVLNKERQSIVSELAEQAIQVVERDFPPDEHPVLIVGGEGWNPGVIGIVASRLVERYYRPTIVLSYDREKGLAKGSARSIEGFDIFAELSVSRDILPHFGGHPMAAGLTMKLEDVDLLRQRLNAQAKESLTADDFIPITKIDLVASVDEVSIATIKEMEELAPFGVSNPLPKVMLKDVHIAQMRQIGSESNHLKIAFQQNGVTLDGIGFQFGYLYDEISSSASVSAIGTLSINEWNGHIKPQFMLQDVAVHDWQLFDWRSIQQAKLAERLRCLPEEERLLVSFQPETKAKLGLEEFEIFNGTDKTSLPVLDGRYVVFLDAPNERSQLRQFFQGKGFPSRIYTIFYQQEDSFFTTNPTREHFKWFYSFLVKQRTFDLKAHAERLAKHKGWSNQTITFMSKVFLELGFVTISDGKITVTEKPEKKGLDESITFRRKQEQAQIENEFVYSSYEQLKQWFSNVIQVRGSKETIS
ncbi:single-stranded-DNA-specific exonuclease RecJ [Halalkalibacterium ligniniphilum]|uniref:single-stranded-DNA-specific exonuclease RecJ n=1 Tax=Halalkalibacterium ligniniphilum TaxID=1134413 RepID=UPI000346A2B6|nr:single-stranded-DNA-specific exonuclease RecJ [Halalkalibacterium ligniniphilum]